MKCTPGSTRPVPGAAQARRVLFFVLFRKRNNHEATKSTKRSLIPNDRFACFVTSWLGLFRDRYQTDRSNGLAGAGSLSRALRAASMAALLSASGATQTLMSVSSSSANFTFTV